MIGNITKILFIVNIWISFIREFDHKNPTKKLIQNKGGLQLIMLLNGLLSIIYMNFSSFISPNRIVKNTIPNPQKIFTGKFLKIPLYISFNSNFIKSILNT